MSNIQQTYSLLQQMYALMQQIESKAKTTNEELAVAVASIQVYTKAIRQTAQLIYQLTGDENIQKATQLMANAAMVVTQLNFSLNLLMTSHPYLAALGFAGLAFSTVNMAGSYV